MECAIVPAYSMNSRNFPMGKLPLKFNKDQRTLAPRLMSGQGSLLPSAIIDAKLPHCAAALKMAKVTMGFTFEVR